MNNDYSNKNEEQFILGIESSCDDSCICLLRIQDGRIICNKSYNQVNIHKKYQGIVPNLAANEHLNTLHVLMDEIICEHTDKIGKIKYIAVTNGPGLVGSLLVGINFAYGLQNVLQQKYHIDIPVVLTDHIIGHLMVNKINNHIEYPFLGLVLSGGHSLILYCESNVKYNVICTTLDDAIGECLDKCGRFLNLPYPGGVYIEKNSVLGNNIVPLPVPMGNVNNKNKDHINFSFSGIKTAVYRIKDKYAVADICCSLQHVLIQSVKNALQKAVEQYNITTIVVGGGVIANTMFKNSLRSMNSSVVMEYSFFFPDREKSTDSALIPASVVLEALRQNNIESMITYYQHSIKPKVYTNIKYNPQFSFMEGKNI